MIIPTQETIIVLDAKKYPELKNLLFCSLPFSFVDRSLPTEPFELQVSSSKEDIDALKNFIKDKPYFTDDKANNKVNEIIEFMESLEKQHIKFFIYKKVKKSTTIKVKIKENIEVDRQYYFQEMEDFVSSYKNRVIEVEKVINNNQITYKAKNLDYYHFFESMIENFVL